MRSVATIEKAVMSKKQPEFCVGDTIRVHLKVKEGDKTRTQIFEGVCIRRRGSQARESFTVVKETHGDLVEKVFPLYSPAIEKITVSRKGKVRRAKLYHLRKK